MDMMTQEKNEGKAFVLRVFGIRGQVLIILFRLTESQELVMTSHYAS
jgi:hypothetical protein